MSEVLSAFPLLQAAVSSSKTVGPKLPSLAPETKTNRPHSKELMQSISLAEAQEHLIHIADLFEDTQQADAKPEAVTVTRSGKPILAILPYEAYEALLETLEVLGDPELMAALHEGIEAADRGETVSLETVRRELGLK